MSMRKIKRKKINKISKIIFLIFFILSLITLGIIFCLKILPTKYTTPILIIYVIGLLILGLILLNPKIKKKIPFDIICVILIIILGFVLYYLNTTMHFMNKIQSKKYQTETYYIITLKDSKYNKTSDLQNKTIGIYSKTSENALEKITNLNTKKYNDIIEMTNNLLSKNIDAIFISESYLTFIEEENENFENKIKIIDTITIKIQNKITNKNVDVTKESFNIYISGIDISGDISSISRSDVNMIMTVNPTTNKILLTSIPRDYYVQLHGTTGYKDKLTHAGLYGINMSVETIEDLLDININYYIRVNFTTLIDVVDAIGGVDVYSDYTFTSYNGNYSFIKGYNHMNGDQALCFSRERYAYKEGDRQRVKNQQAVLTGIVKKITTSSALLTKYTSILNSLSDSFETNMDSSNIYSLVNKQLDEMSTWDIESISLNGYDSSNYTYSYSSEKLYVMEPDYDTVTLATEKINEISK